MPNTNSDINWLWTMGAVNFCLGLLLFHQKSTFVQAIYFSVGGGLCIGNGIILVIVVTGVWQKSIRDLQTRNFEYPDYRPPRDIPTTFSKFSDKDWIRIVTIVGFSRGLCMVSKLYGEPNVGPIQAGTEFCCWGALFGLAAGMSTHYLNNYSENKTELVNPFMDYEKRKAEYKKKFGNDAGEPCSSVPASTKESWEQLTEEDWLEIRRSGTVQTEAEWMEIGRRFHILKQAGSSAEA